MCLQHPKVILILITEKKLLGREKYLNMLRLTWECLPVFMEMNQKYTI